jgi:hypothetical protein
METFGESVSMRLRRIYPKYQEKAKSQRMKTARLAIYFIINQSKSSLNQNFPECQSKNPLMAQNCKGQVKTIHC